MEKRKKVGLQIRFNHNTEKDVIAFFDTIKKPEVHIIAITAFRMYMRSVGFYERKWFENIDKLNILNQMQNVKSFHSKTVENTEIEGVLDENEFKILDSMFDEENR